MILQKNITFVNKTPYWYNDYKSMDLRIKKLHQDAIAPKYDLPGDAGLGLYSIETKTLRPGERHSFATGVAIEIPEGHVGLIWDRSGLSHNHGLKTLGGVIDSNFRGEWKVGIINLSLEPYTIQAGHKIAQFIIQPIPTIHIEEVEQLSKPDIDHQGFGSTGY